MTSSRSSRPQRDLIAENIADYDSLADQERGQLIAQVMEDQPFLMGFLTNLADDFSDSEHEVLVDSLVILINSFVAAGIPLDTIPDALIAEVIEEKTESYQEGEDRLELTADNVNELVDSPLVFEDLRHRAILKSDLKRNDSAGQHNFILILDALIAIVERSLTEKGPADEEENSTS